VKIIATRLNLKVMPFWRVFSFATSFTTLFAFLRLVSKPFLRIRRRHSLNHRLNHHHPGHPTVQKGCCPCSSDTPVNLSRNVRLIPHLK
jgi:hypothetical protein